MSKDQDYDFLFKLVLIGSSGVGKSNILARYTKNQFVENWKATIGVQFASKKLMIKDKIIKLQIWDTAGQERYKAIAKAYYKGASAALLVYDISDQKSFVDLDIWYKEIYDYLNKNEIIVMLVGNKLDKEAQREVKRQRGLEYAESRKLAFHQVSAADGTNIENIFTRIAEELYNLTNKPAEPTQQPVEQGEKKKEGTKEEKGQVKSKIKLNKSTVKEEKTDKKCC